ncbi:MAG: hypothetical protein QM785_18435 [Pyrinomonadaceae bacterium]
MRVLLLTLGVIFVFAAASFGQAGEKPKAHKFAEFGRISAKQMSVKIKAFHDLLRIGNDRGYVINYGTPRAIRDRKKLIMKSISWREYDPTRITFVDGPLEKKTRTVMWIVPQGAENPIP